MSARKKDDKRYKEIRNAKASHDYFVEETLECGIILAGTEVKAIRQGLAQIADAYVRIDRRRVWLCQANIAEYSHGSYTNHPTYRARELLMHQRERMKWEQAMQTGGMTAIPLRIYFKNGLIKVQVGLCRGKKEYDKRQTLRNAEDKREIQRTMRAAIKR